MQTLTKPERRDYYRSYYERNREAIRAKQRAAHALRMSQLPPKPKPVDSEGRNVTRRMPQRSKAQSGNAKYQELLRLEREWLKRASYCEICKQWHPPMKGNYID